MAVQQALDGAGAHVVDGLRRGHGHRAHAGAQVVVEKGKAVGSHSLSGAMVNPQPLRDLFPDLADADLPTYGAVDK
ncbi:MAG: hypothetical protein ACKOSO_06165, partial [Actinomycetota bacterium]